MRWLESRPHGAVIFDGVVSGSQILAYLARTLVETCLRKRYCYDGWAVCQFHLKHLFQVVVRAIGPEFQRRVLWGYRVVALAAAHDDDTLRTVLSDDYVPDVDLDNSQNDYTTGLLFHRQTRQEILWHRWLLSREYARCWQFLMTQPEGEDYLQHFG